MFAYPVEVISDIYLSKIGGFSPELGRREIGINVRALEMNTSIIANETYAKIRLFGERAYPYFFRRTFRIIGLEEHMEGYEFSQNGEVVLSEELMDEFCDFIGREVMINTVESFRMKNFISSIFQYYLCSEGQREKSGR